MKRTSPASSSLYTNEMPHLLYFNSPDDVAYAEWLKWDQAAQEIDIHRRGIYFVRAGSTGYFPRRYSRNRTSRYRSTYKQLRAFSVHSLLRLYYDHIVHGCSVEILNFRRKSCAEWHEHEKCRNRFSRYANARENARQRQTSVYFFSLFFLSTIEIRVEI